MAGPGVMPRTMGDRIVLLLRHRGWLLSDLATATGIPASTLSRYVNDETQPPPQRLVLIATALETTPNDLLGFRDEDSDKGT
jgi:transcriptional regulator with XRE-family HTH domain